MSHTKLDDKILITRVSYVKTLHYSQVEARQRVEILFLALATNKIHHMEHAPKLIHLHDYFHDLNTKNVSGYLPLTPDKNIDLFRENKDGVFVNGGVDSVVRTTDDLSNISERVFVDSLIPELAHLRRNQDSLISAKVCSGTLRPVLFLYLVRTS
ncbi:hypothetical protein K501DRAFT_267754 [Backusella circina FSU 941]|nr:hypothetical protein K501DRAFT_267754 [Backusella circina FSU 941]